MKAIRRITVTSFGAAETVTGSCHLIEADDVKILVDCGMFQGHDERLNYEPLGFEPSEIDYLVLTHAHIDHIGRVPFLVKKGFSGRIITTPPTRSIAKIMLLDAAKVMLEDYKIHYRKARRRGKEHEVPPPLYDELDVYDAMELFGAGLPYDEPFKLSEGITLTLKNASHILGSAYAVFDFETVEGRKRVVFSGDLGMEDGLILEPLDYLEDEVDALFVESTYGNRNHKPLEDSIVEFREAVVESFDDGGNILIPTFSLERAQEILYLLNTMYREGELPKSKVFLDSPLAIAATRIFVQFPDYMKPEIREMMAEGENPFMFPYVSFTQSVEESKAINNVESGAIILAGSGMCTGGRIRHHLKHNLWRPETSVIFVGYQARGTLGRIIIDGAEHVKIYGEEIAVRARIYTIGGFSSHADQRQLLKWISAFKSIDNLYLIHGEEEVLDTFKAVIKDCVGYEAHIVKKFEPIPILY